MAWTVDSLTFNTRKTVTADYTLVPSDQSDFPVPFIISADANIGADGTANGGDVRFTLVVGGTLLTYERELWSVTGGQATAVWHVKIPTLSSTVNTQVYCYYNTSTGSPPDGDDGGAGNVWDASYKGVWHMNQDPSGGAPQMLDSTANNNDGTSAGTMTSGDLVDAKIGKGLDFDGSDDFISRETLTGLGTESSASFECWLKADSLGSYDSVVRIASAPSILISGATGNPLTYMWEGAADEWDAATGLAITLGTWYYAAVRITPTAATVYLNTGSWVNTKTHNAKNLNNNLLIGKDPDIAGRLWDGLIDEVRISNVARTANYILTSYRAQANLLLSWGAEEVASAGALPRPMGSYFFRGVKYWLN